MDRSELFTRYSELVLRHERMIRTLCLRQSDDAELLKDLAQEVRIGLWERYLACGGNLGVWPEALWVYWQTRTVTSRRRRLQRAELVRLSEQMVETIAAGDDAAAELVDELAEGLPELYADLLRQLREGYSVAEIAERCGEPLATVKSRRQRLVEQLRRRAEALGKIQDNTNIQPS